MDLMDRYDVCGCRYIARFRGATISLNIAIDTRQCAQSCGNSGVSQQSCVLSLRMSGTRYIAAARVWQGMLPVGVSATPLSKKAAPRKGNHNMAAAIRYSVALDIEEWDITGLYLKLSAQSYKTYNGLSCKLDHRHCRRFLPFEIRR